MKFDRFSVTDAEGVILAHTLRLPGLNFKKGTALTAEHIQSLRDHGVESVSGVRMQPGDIDENQAAAAVAHVLAGEGLTIGKPSAGRCNLYAEHHGLAIIDQSSIDAINLAGGAITVATLPHYSEAFANQAVATVKVIPFAVPRSQLDRCVEIATTAVSAAPFRRHDAALILTRTPAIKDSTLSSTHEVTLTRLRALGSNLTFHQVCGHNVDDVSASLRQALARGCNPVLICGAGITVDVGDVVPAAITRCGGTIDHFGMPVEPGNMLLLAHHGETSIVILPGCARSPKLNGLDWVLQRLLADVPVTPNDIMRMGVGGLIKDARLFEKRHRRLAEPPEQPRIAAVILAAGRSRRMGRQNKLLSLLDGTPMVVRVADAAQPSNAVSVTVVCGHQAADIQQALSGRSVQFCYNGDYASGIASSIKCGIDHIPADVDGAIILLGDMPFVSEHQINELIAEFDPELERDIVAPVRDGRRGNPVLWSRRYFPLIRKLTGDVGARSIINDYAGNVWEVPVYDEAVFADIDTADELTFYNSNS